MKKRVVFLALILVIINACEEDSYKLCPDNVTQVLDLANCPEIVPECPVCDDNNTCTIDFCGQTSDYKCRYTIIDPCDGNGVCEVGEFPWSEDCPFNCDDENKCTADKFNFKTEQCYHEQVVPCCGNNQCDTGETFVNCETDCEQVLDITINFIERKQRFSGSYYGNLLRSDNMFMIVNFKIHNIDIDLDEELDYREFRGFFYDPYKMRLEDETGELYAPEYDSDLLEAFKDLTVIPKGILTGAALLFVVPQDHKKNWRFVAYDRYGNRLDVEEIS